MSADKPPFQQSFARNSATTSSFRISHSEIRISPSPIDLVVAPIGVDDRQDFQCQKCGADKAADHGGGDSFHDIGASAGGPEKRH